MNDPGKNILIGLFVVSASAIVIFVLLFLHPTIGDDAQLIKVRFANIDKISVGTRVTYGGRPVGEVIEIREIEEPKDPRKPGKDGFVYLYELVLTADSSVRVYNTDQIHARTSGLLGEKSVEITPLPVKPGEKAYLVTEQVLYANESGSVEEAIKEFKELSDKIEGTLDSFKFAIDELNRSKIWERLGETARNVRDITDELNQPGKWRKILDNVENVSDTLVESLDKFDQTMENAYAFSEDLKVIGVDIREVTGGLRQGRGTLGGILVRDDMYLRTTSVMSKAETLMDDINTYGLLFQNNKRWQRLRARRANLITQLREPQEFRNYFNDELNNITSSLTRISMVLQETEGCDCYGAYMDDCEFRKVFAELMRRVIQMEESLKMYNEQVVERDVLKTELCPCLQ